MYIARWAKAILSLFHRHDWHELELVPERPEWAENPFYLYSPDILKVCRKCHSSK